MDSTAQEARRLQTLVELAFGAQAPQDEIRFGLEFFSRIDPDELDFQPAERLAAALSRVRAELEQRGPGQARIKVDAANSELVIVNDDMPFLVDSVLMELNRQGWPVQLILHPIVSVERDEAGRLSSLGQGSLRESVMWIALDRRLDPDSRSALLDGLTRVLGDVRAAVSDWPAMRAQLLAAAEDLLVNPARQSAAELAEAAAFVKWLADDHFVLLGCRRHELVEREGEILLRRMPGSSLGLLRETSDSPEFSALPQVGRAAALGPSPLIITKANSRSTVHRPAYLDFVAIKRFDAQGRVIGEQRFLGLLTSSAYAARVAEVPLVRGKVAQLIARAGLAPGSHLAKAAAHILETYPRDELLQAEVDELHGILAGILALGERQRLRLFVRHDAFGRFVSCLVYVPRDAYSTELRQRFQALLTEAFGGSAHEFDVLLTDDALARIHITVRTTPGEVPEVDRRQLEARLAEAARRWEDRLLAALSKAQGEALGHSRWQRWASGFPAAYREQETIDTAVLDLAKIEVTGGASFLLYAPRVGGGKLGFKIYHADSPVPLSDSLPMLEAMGVRALEEHPYRLVDVAGRVMWIHDFLLEAPAEVEVDIESLAPVFEDVYAKLFSGQIERDDFNRLALHAGLDASSITILRAYAKYLKQARFELSQSFIEATLVAHPAIARQLVQLFRLRFDPVAADAEAEATQVRAIELALEKVAKLNEDRVLRQLLALICATLRTNAWRGRSFLSFKFDSSAIPGLPEPRPWVEIFVYSPRFEGIHLRGGKVARGGLRWSDRPEDFRTEVLGLVKAQRVKNTVIVPVGSKGGFVLKKAPPATEREAYLAEGVACYQDYLRGLLDLTDNLVAGAVVPPESVTRHDADDPYLVVAADKGTASFSDFANAISAEYGFWLGDAFASGGSVGYDHKKMGITARGAWEAVKRHFRGFGRNIQVEAFTCVGIGDMSGDVFGNGLLLSRATRLVAAFDHRHVFIDPTPDAATSFAERERLFALPRSSWVDYEARLISAGGGVWSRAEKSIPVSDEAARVLGIEPGRLSPNDLIRAILKAPVDLLYNGGIGTYVKAEGETHAEVGDRANDAVRVNGADLRCKVVGEGGNLGFTQRGRIEFALAGGCINTDAIDNSAGVDTSDHEVNIKILLGAEVAAGRLGLAERNALLARMSDEVARLVLADNIAQTRILALGGRLAVKQFDEQLRLIRFLERSGRLDRAIEFLPDEEESKRRAAAGLALSTPERAVLLAYSKIWLRGELLASDLPDDPALAHLLPDYFPLPLREGHAAAMAAHPLRREIIVTALLNEVVNRSGASFVHRLVESSGQGAAAVVRAWWLARQVFGLDRLWAEIDAIEDRLPVEVLDEMLIELGRLALRATSWFLHSPRLGDPMEASAAMLAPAAEVLAKRLAAQLEPRAWLEAGVPEVLARRVRAAEASHAALDIAEVAARTGAALEHVAEVHLALEAELELGRLRRAIAALPTGDHWQALARSAASEELAAVARALTAAVAPRAALAEVALAAWRQGACAPLARLKALLAELGEQGFMPLPAVLVVLRELRALV